MSLKQEPGPHTSRISLCCNLPSNVPPGKTVASATLCHKLIGTSSLGREHGSLSPLFRLKQKTEEGGHIDQPQGPV